MEWHLSFGARFFLFELFLINHIMLAVLRTFPCSSTGTNHLLYITTSEHQPNASCAGVFGVIAPLICDTLVLLQMCIWLCCGCRCFEELNHSSTVFHQCLAVLHKYIIQVQLHEGLLLCDKQMGECFAHISGAIKRQPFDGRRWCYTSSALFIEYWLMTFTIRAIFIYFLCLFLSFFVKNSYHCSYGAEKDRKRSKK